MLTIVSAFFLTMNIYKNRKLKEIAKNFVNGPSDPVVISGESFRLDDMHRVGKGKSKISLSADKEIIKRISEGYDQMMNQVKEGVPIYGVNTGYGGQADLVVNKGSVDEKLKMAQKISESIVHVDVSTGPAVPKDITRVAMAIRANMLMKGVSAVRKEDLEMYCSLLNNDLIPKVGVFGGLGASGDLPQNGRVLSVMRQLAGTKIWKGDSSFEDAPMALQKKGLKPLHIEPKAGLGLVNGDNFSTAAAFHLTRETMFVLLTQAVIGSMMLEMLLATNRSLHPLVSEVRPHQGQGEVADVYRKLIKGSQYIRDEMKVLLPRVEGRKVQDVYSIRCLTQFLGVSWERVKWAMETIEINANSTSDNPLWVPKGFETEGEDSWQWVSGGNFLAEYMVEVMDSLRKTLTHVVKLNDRHIARLIDPHENNGLTPNLSHKDAISQCSFKGVQAQAGMFDVYSMFLSMPISTLFGVHEQNNQDLTSHAMTSGHIGRELLKVTWLSLAQTSISLAQAVDLREGKGKLAPKTLKFYNYIRDHVGFVKSEQPLGPQIELIAEKLQTTEFRKLLVEDILAE